MIDKTQKWWLAAMVICCLAPATFALSLKCDPRDKNCKQAQVPEGGSTAVYVLGAGITCFGAIYLRSRMAKPTQS
jgi:hypothetical protein